MTYHPLFGASKVLDVFGASNPIETEKGENIWGNLGPVVKHLSHLSWISDWQGEICVSFHPIWDVHLDIS